jgi:hypothetical protein
MSTLTVTNIKATGETVSRAVSGVAAAWVNFNGTGTIAARDSVNVASLTDNGTGDYTVNINNDMSNANYTISANASFDGGGFTGQQNAQPKADFTPTTALYRIAASNSSNAVLNDATKVYSTIHGDLA